METKLIRSDDLDGIRYAATLIRKGEIVAFPTETVYGLGADAQNKDAVRRIFEAKGRPQDNPLIVHTAFPEDISKYAYTESSKYFEMIAKEFMPGPITVILPKRSNISYETTAGLDSVGMRCPSDETAHNFILYSERPIAAPSANTSGRPSPTAAEHVLEDMNGRIPCIIDGGKARIGLESTVVSLLGDKVRVLRPGGVTVEMLKSLCGEENVVTDEGVFGKLKEGVKPLSPGMMYRHYAPKAPVKAVRGTDEAVLRFFKERFDEGAGILCWTEDAKVLPANRRIVPIGGSDDHEEQARMLFDALRSFDDMDVSSIYARCPDKGGMGLAVYNRLLRACSFEVMEIE